MSKDLKISLNSDEGVQVEWRGILLTLRINPAHGLMGSIGEMDGDKIRLLEFHGAHPEKPMPFSFHETTMKTGDITK